MRSTGFIVLSLMVHGLAVAALVLAPRQIGESQGHEVEVTLGETANNPGVADAPKAEEEIPPPAKTKTDSKPVIHKDTTEEPKVTEPTQPKEQPKRVAKIQKSKPSELPAKTLPPKLDPVVSDDTPTQDNQQAEVQKEEKPDGVIADDAANADDDTADIQDDQTEATSEEVAKTEDPAPVGVSEDNAAGGIITKGGATPAGAVAYTNLRQMNGNKPPVYPLTARKEGRQGQVLLLYRVTRDGQVTDVQVAHSSGSQDLDDEAVRAISQYKFVPGQEGWARHPVDFTLTGETVALPSRLRTHIGGAQDH